MRFGVLGPLAVWTDEGEPVALPERKVRRVLWALLAAEGRAVSVQRLTEVLWGGRPPVSAAGTLQSKVSALRRVTGRESVFLGPSGYRLERAPGAVDADQFGNLVRRARSADTAGARAGLLGEALALWRGGAFSGVADEPFARGVVARLEEERLTVVEEWALARLELGEHGPLAGELAEWAERFPVRERLAGLRMRALYGMGRQADALAVFAELRGQLAVEQGLDPGAELVGLQRAVLARDPSLTGPASTPAPVPTPVPEPVPAPVPTPVPTPAGVGVSAPGAPDAGAGSAGADRGERTHHERVRSNITVPLTELVGRAGALAEVRSSLSAGRLVTLTGPGGVGKTRLALETAVREEERYPDGVWLVELAGLTCCPRTDRDLTTPAEAIATVLGASEESARTTLPPGAPVPVIDRLVQMLRDQRLLLVLDNGEHVVEPLASLVEQLLRAAPGLRVLVTSQEPLAVQGETVRPVPPLAQRDAERLFVTRAAASVPGFAPTGEEAKAVATLCRRLDGIPLALELAATRVRALGMTALAARLDDRFRLLTSGHRTAPPRQQTLRAMIDWSWELLTATERTVLRRLAVHVDGCTLEAAETVTADAALLPEHILDVLARLVDRSLVSVTHGPRGPRYRLLESIRAYAGERLHESGEHAALQQRHYSYYAGLAARAAPHLRGFQQHSWLLRLDAETTNLRTAFAHALSQQDPGPALRLIESLTWYWYLRGRANEARRWLHAGLSHPAPPTSDLHASILAWQAGISLLTRDQSDAELLCRTALQRLAQAKDTRLRTRGEWFLLYAQWGSEGLDDSGAWLSRLLREFRTAGDRWGEAATLALLARQKCVRGDLHGLRRDGEQSLATFLELGDRWGQMQATDTLSELAEITGDYDLSFALREQGLRISEQLGLWAELCFQWSGLGRIALLRGDHAQAEVYHGKGRELAIQHSQTAARQHAEIGLALGARRQGKLDVAERYLRYWLDWSLQREEDPPVELLLGELGFIAELRQDAGSALRLHREGYERAWRHGGPRAVALALEGIAGAMALAGRHRTAARLLGSATASRQDLGAPLPSAERADTERVAAAARTALGSAAYQRAYAEGGQLTPAQARALADG